MPRKTKEDRAAYERARRAIPEVRDRKNAYAREYHKNRVKDPEVLARIRAVRHAWNQKNRDKRNALSAKYRVINRSRFLVAQMKKRAKDKGLPFDLDKHAEDIQRRIDAGFCELTGYPFDLTPCDVKGVRKFNGPSVDRIDNDKGYTYDNIRIVLSIVNYAMNIWGEDVLREVMEHWLKK